jgi:hypothetical protein
MKILLQIAYYVIRFVLENYLLNLKLLLMLTEFNKDPTRRFGMYEDNAHIMGT